MKRIKTVIVDDEQLARKRIEKLLSSDEDIHIVAKFSQGKDAIAFMENHVVDMLYLDIHMPEVDGFAVLNQLSENKRPFVVFATADKEAAIKAFEYKALDYLLKPFRNQRFYESLENAKTYVRLKNKAELSDRFLDLMEDFKRPSQHNLRVKSDQAIDFDDILYIKADGNYLRLYQNSSNYHLLRKTMNQLITELNHSDFLRIHRSLLVNPYFINHIHYLGNNEFEIHLSSNIRLKSSRSYKKDIDFYLSKRKP